MKNLYHKGVRTFYLPLDRGPEISPEVTLLVYKNEGGYKVAYSICSKKDPFEKRKGRAIAFNRFNNDYCLLGASLLPVVATLATLFRTLNSRRPGTISTAAINDLLKIPPMFNKKFVKELSEETQKLGIYDD